MKTPVVSLEDLPYTISLVATVSSQHGIDRIQSNCSLSPVEYLGDNKTSAQVIHKRALSLLVPFSFRSWPWSSLSYSSLFFLINPEGITLRSLLIPALISQPSLCSCYCSWLFSLVEEACSHQLWPQPLAEAAIALTWLLCSQLRSPWPMDTSLIGMWNSWFTTVQCIPLV